MDLQSILSTPMGGGTGAPLATLLFALLLAFIVGQLNAWFYMWTHRGISYSRTFTHALILISVAAALCMSMVMHSPVAVFGLLGGMAIIRFRTVVRDPRDIVYVLLSLICGMAAGFGFYATAIVGAVLSNLIAYYLTRTGFGSWQSTESMLRFRVAPAVLNSRSFDRTMHHFCRRHSPISVDEGLGAEADVQCVYRVRLRDPERAGEFVSQLRDSLRVEAVHLLVDQENEEVS